MLPVCCECHHTTVSQSPQLVVCFQRYRSVCPSPAHGGGPSFRSVDRLRRTEGRTRSVAARRVVHPRLEAVDGASADDENGIPLENKEDDMGGKTWRRYVGGDLEEET